MSGGERSLTGIDFFRGLDEKDLRTLAQLCHWHSYDRGQLILGHQDQSTDVFFIVTGKVRVAVYSPSGKEVSFGELDAGDMFGEIAAIDGGPRSASITAESNALIAAMSAGAFSKVLETHPHITARLLLQFAELVRKLSTRVFEFSVLAVKNRIHAELLRLARRTNIDGNQATLSPAPTHSEIASRVSTHREAVTRELNALAKDGLILRSGNALVITNIDRLAQMVEEVIGE